MNWTKTPPTKPGAYWWRTDETDRHPNAMEVRRVLGKLLCGSAAHERGTVLLDIGGEWCGPLVPVEEVERAWHEGFETKGKPDSMTFDGEGVEVPNFENSRARRVVEGEEQV